MSVNVEGSRNGVTGQSPPAEITTSALMCPPPAASLTKHLGVPVHQCAHVNKT